MLHFYIMIFDIIFKGTIRKCIAQQILTPWPARVTFDLITTAASGGHNLKFKESV